MHLGIANGTSLKTTQGWKLLFKDYLREMAYTHQGFSQIPDGSEQGPSTDTYIALALLLLILGTALIYGGWIGHALVGLAGVLLLICAVVMGAMLTGRIKRGEGDIFKLHKKRGMLLGSILLGTFFYGLWIKLAHNEPVLRSVHGWLGLIILLLVAQQIIPSLYLSDRSRLRGPHKVLGYALVLLIVIDVCWGLYMGVVEGSKSLVLVHSLSGGMAALALTWVLVEMLYPTAGGVARGRIASYLAAFFVLAGCWSVGGYNYLTSYGSRVKPVILAGSEPWAHQVVMETKEHIFIFLPAIVLALSLTLATVNGESLAKNPGARRAVVVIASLALFIVLLMFFMGAIVSNAGKSGLGGPM